MFALAGDKARSWVGSALQVLALACLLLAALVLLPNTGLFNRLAERLTVFDGGYSLMRRLGDRPAPKLATQQQGFRLRRRAPPFPSWPPAERSRASPPPVQCDLQVGHSPFDQCELIEDACVDQGRLILYGRQYRPERMNGPAINLPVLKPPVRQSKFYLPYWKQNNKDMRAGLPPIHVRAASAREPRQYLAEPSFSNCTIPVVFYQMNSFNFAHVMRDNAARMWSALEETSWADHVRLVLMTGEGLPVSPMAMGVWQPISKMRLTSWAEFSVRLPDDQVGPGAPPAAPGKLPPSFEGTEQRCFRRMYVCLNDITPERYQLHAYGQHLARFYGGQELVRSMALAQPPAAVSLPRPQSKQQQLPAPVSILQRLGRGRKVAPGEQELHIVFLKRSSGDRQILNIGELLERCNSWRLTAPSGARLRALCWEAATSSLEAGIAAAQQADVMVGSHGASLANAFFMRPGGSTLELTMHEFEELSPAHSNFAMRNMEDVGTQIQWWKLLLCDEASWAPGIKETIAIRKGTPKDKDAAKHRDLIVSWQAIQTALAAIVDTAGDMDAYRRRYRKGKWWWLSTNSSAMYAGPDLAQTCRRARKQGLLP